MDGEEKSTIVIDNGSSVFKAGFAGHDSPSVVFPALVGRPKYIPFSCSKDNKDCYIGDETHHAMRDLLCMEYPIEHGIVKNWDHMEKLLAYTFNNKLMINTEEHPVLISEASLNPKGNRECMTQVMFESFNVPSFYVGNDNVLGLYSAGRVSGIVLDSGGGVTDVVPVYEGNAQAHAMKRIDLGGKDLTMYLQKLLNEKGHSFTTSYDTEIVRDMKELLCYNAMNFTLEMGTFGISSGGEKCFQLPDGNTVRIGSDRFQCPEILFQPSLAGYQLPGVHELIYSSIMDCDIDMRRDLFINIFLHGGNTMFKGFHERVHVEMKLLKPRWKQLMVRACPDREIAVWIGGSILASLSDFLNQVCITRKEYDEVGPAIVHRKCF